MENNERINKYVQPVLARYHSFEELEEHNPFLSSEIAGNYFTFDDFFSTRRAFVIAEPGYGKTRLLKEIIVAASKKNLQGIFIDLKKVDRDLESFISNPTRFFESITPESLGEDLKEISLSNTNGFLLKNSEETIICLDALDEVKQQNFSNVIDWIKLFSKKWDSVSILISGRKHHQKKYSNLFINMGFDYILIDAFGSEQIEIYLEQSGLKEEQIKRIIEISKSKNQQLLLEVPRYLEMVIEFMAEKGIDNFSDTTRGDLFDFFIYRKLEIEERKIDQQSKDFTKRVLEKVALLMEMYQTNTLTKDELMTFFDDVKSDLKINFLQQVPLQSFYDRSLLKDNIDTIEFENTSFQEYLAAKEIKRLGRTDQIIFELSVDKELREIYPSWLDTLGFVIDLDISILKSVLDFGYSKGKAVEIDEYYRLLTTVDTNRLTLKERSEIFETVFSYYQCKSGWIDQNVAYRLSFYYDSSLNAWLKENIDGRKSKGFTLVAKRANVAAILEYLFENKQFNQEEISHWKNRLIEFTREENSVLKRMAVSALSKLKDVSVIKKISHLFDSGDDLVVQEFFRACVEINPNAPISISIFVKGKKMANAYGEWGLEEITERESIKLLLDYFINDNDFREHFTDPEFRKYVFKRRESKIFRNIRAVHDSNIQMKLETIIKKEFLDFHKEYSKYSDFFMNLVRLVKENNSDFIFSLISEIKKQGGWRFHGLVKVLSEIIEKEQVGRFIRELQDIENGKGLAFSTLFNLKNSDKDGARAIHEEGRKFFPEMYKQYEDASEEQSFREYYSEEEYEEFKCKLERENGEYSPDVFSFYLRHKENFEHYIKDVDRERLKKLTISFFENNNLEKGEPFITRREGNSMQYTVDARFKLFGDCITIANELSIDISQYKKKIIYFIPYADHRQLKQIFSLFPEFSNEDIDILLNIYSGKRKDDLDDFSPGNFVESCEKYKIIKAVPILKKFVDKKDLDITDRKGALKVISILKRDEFFFKEVFENYKIMEDASRRLAEDANKYLIEIFLNSAAIDWRFKQLIERNHPFQRRMEMHEVDAKEEELNTMGFAKPIRSLKDPSYLNSFINLLDKSLEIYHKGNEYSAYAKYLWEVIAHYLENLKENRNYGPLNQVEKFVMENSSRPGINWFAERLRHLKREYMNYIGKPQYFSECIKQYNRLKERQYLDISNPRELFEILKDVMENDLRKWIEKEGAYRFIRDVRGKQEDLIQKTLKTQLENSVLRRGLRDADFIREPQLLDAQRADFLVYYGFIGPVLLEIKRLDNPEIQNKSKRLSYGKKLKKYMEGFKADFGIYLIFSIKDDDRLDYFLNLVRESLEEYTKITVIGLDCRKL